MAQSITTITEMQFYDIFNSTLTVNWAIEENPLMALVVSVKYKVPSIIKRKKKVIHLSNVYVYPQLNAKDFYLVTQFNII